MITFKVQYEDYADADEIERQHGQRRTWSVHRKWQYNSRDDKNYQNYIMDILPKKMRVYVADAD